MATNTFNSIYHNHHSLRRRRLSLDHHPPTTATNPFFLKPTTAGAAVCGGGGGSLSAVFAVSSAAPTTTTSQNVSFDLLRHHLSTKNFRQADEETRRLLIVLAGDAAVKRGYVFFSEVQFIPADDLKTIDELWRTHSGDKFGYSVQKKIFKKSNKDFTKFFIKIGWMKKLESSEVEQFNYRAFPAEFMWEMEEGTPEGHLPLTNALRGTQLLNSVLNHPAFEGDDDGEDDDDEWQNGEKQSIGVKPLMSNRGFKPNYTF